MTDVRDPFPPPSVPQADPTTSIGAASATPSTAIPPSRRRHTFGHVAAIVVGSLALLPGVGLLAGGTAAAAAQAFATDEGYFRFTPDRVTSDGVAVITDDEWLDADDGGPWVLDWLDLDVRLRATGAPAGDDVFVGIARTADVESYLDQAQHSVVDEIDGHQVVYREEPGDATVVAPTRLDIWAASAHGTGERELRWDATGGRWSLVVMNADGTPGVAADVEIGVRSDAVVPIAVTFIALGGLTVLGGVALVVVGARGRRPRR